MEKQPHIEADGHLLEVCSENGDKVSELIGGMRSRATINAMVKQDKLKK